MMNLNRMAVLVSDVDDLIFLDETWSRSDR